MIKTSPKRRASGSEVRRRFIRVRGRGVHYVRAGSGPPVVILHAGLGSANWALPLMRQLLADHTVFAFDHPGYGESDPLPKRHVLVSDAAEALNDTLLALKMPRCPVYGTHTGAAVAIELAHRYPARVSAVIADGPTVFQPREAKFFLSEAYLPPFIVSDDGSHLFAAWVKTRDTTIWFPWCQRRGKNRRTWVFGSPENSHSNFLDRIRAADGYRAVYGSAFEYDTVKAVSALKMPATFMAHKNDLIFSHLDRLPPLKADQRVDRYSGTAEEYLATKARELRGYRVHTDAPLDAPFRPTPGVINRRYVDLPWGQILVRSAGESRRGKPLLLLHDGRASSRVFEPLMQALAKHRAVYALDLPDNGASDALSTLKPGVNGYADAVERTVDALGLKRCDLYAVGAGAAVALALLTRPPFAKARVVLEAPDFYSPAFARRLLKDWAPPLSPQWDGAHLNRLWLMLRDEYAFWPWFDKSPAAACAVDAPGDWQDVHARVVDILRSLATYHRLTAAALKFDWATALRRSTRRVVIAATEQEPRRPHVEAAARVAKLRNVATLPAPAAQKAQALLRLLSG